MNDRESDRLEGAETKLWQIFYPQINLVYYKEAVLYWRRAVFQ